MAEAVKREYRSELRTARARDTRRRIVAAAAALFASSGYGATSVEAIADAAGVSRKTVFTAVGGKPEVLALALDWAIAGDDEPQPLAARPEVKALLDLDDPREVLSGWARLLTGIGARVGELFSALETAATTEPTAQALFATLSAQRRDGARVVIDAIAARGALRRPLTRSEAVDVAWLFSDPLMYRRLVGASGWSPRRFERWLAQSLQEQLLRR